MKLERIKCKPLEKAKDLCVSPNYIIGCTGQKAAILDKQLNLVHTVDGLEYVYSAQLSPDETKLLLISNCNKFYIVDMQTFEKTRITVRAPYNHNLRGQGCWSFDGKSVWIPVNRQTCYINSTLRSYCVRDLSQFEDFLPDKYVLNGISRIEKTRTYFLTGYNRQENNRVYFIHFDGAAFREIPLEAAGPMIVLAAAIDEENDVVTIAALKGCRQFTLEGKEIQTISHPDPQDKTLHMSDLYKELFGSDADELKTLTAELGLENITAPDYITGYEVSDCGKYIYLASQSGFYLLDAKSGALLASLPEEFGVQNFEALAPGLIAIATWSGVKLYRHTEDQLEQ